MQLRHNKASNQSRWSEIGVGVHFYDHGTGRAISRECVDWSCIDSGSESMVI